MKLKRIFGPLCVLFSLLGFQNAFAVFAYVDGASNTGTSGSPTTGVHGITIGSGDLVVVYIHANDSATAITHGGGEGTAFTIAGDETPAGETARQAIAWKVAGGSEPTSYTFASGNAEWRVLIKVFTSATDAEVDAAVATSITVANTVDLRCDAIDGQVISNDAVSIIACGKDFRSTEEAYTQGEDLHGDVIGGTSGQISAMAHRIYTTGETFVGGVTIDTADGNDGRNDVTYSIHMSWVESSAVQSPVPVILQQH